MRHLAPFRQVSVGCYVVLLLHVCVDYTVVHDVCSLFETSQSLFWASFGLVDLMAFELQGIKSFTRFWAMLMFGSYSVINIIVLLNMLIAMMSNSYQIISERSDIEWKFARSQLWMSYFEDGATVPPPFNLCPSMKMLSMGKRKRFTKSVIVSVGLRSARHARRTRCAYRTDWLCAGAPIRLHLPPAAHSNQHFASSRRSDL